LLIFVSVFVLVNGNGTGETPLLARLCSQGLRASTNHGHELLRSRQLAACLLLSYHSDPAAGAKPTSGPR